MWHYVARMSLTVLPALLAYAVGRALDLRSMWGVDLSWSAITIGMKIFFLVFTCAHPEFRDELSVRCAPVAVGGACDWVDGGGWWVLRSRCRRRCL